MKKIYKTNSSLIMYKALVKYGKEKKLETLAALQMDLHESRSISVTVKTLDNLIMGRNLNSQLLFHVGDILDIKASELIVERYIH